MTNDTVYITNTTKFIASDLGEEMILMNLETGDYVALNAVSAEIWKLAEKEASGSQMIEHLLQQYEVEEEVCRKETESCITEMVEKGLLQTK
jgi:hypothetical protein